VYYQVRLVLLGHFKGNQTEAGKKDKSTLILKLKTQIRANLKK